MYTYPHSKELARVVLWLMWRVTRGQTWTCIRSEQPDTAFHVSFSSDTYCYFKGLY